MRKVAFTLAEVLITLGIVGVVAALTLPTVMSNHRKMVVESKLKKFYSTMSQAVIAAEYEHGEPVQNWDTFSSGSNGSECLEWFNKYLKSKLNVQDVYVDSDNRRIVVRLSDGSGFVMFNYSTNVGSIHFYYYPKSHLLLNENKHYAMTKDGTERFTFRMVAHGNRYKFATYYEGLGADEIKKADYGCRQDVVYRHGCAALIQANGWKVPDDYPFGF